jgi:hypothetical protein
VNPSPRVHPLLWAIFLGISWTWCIGMFLPVLLVRDYGVWGWIVFAIPNVIGAAAMGWVLRDGDASRRIVEAHAPACAAFSIVTLAFHIFFIGWLNSLFAGFAPLALAAAAICYLLGMARRSADAIVAIGVLVVSVAGMILYDHFGLSRDLMQRGFDPALWGLIPVCCFGFLFCPYLDLTFHRARQSTTPTGGRIAFTLGFGCVFLLMILFTLFYAKHPVFKPLLAGYRNRAPGVYWPNVIAVHMIVQIGFTLAVHARALVEQASRRGDRTLLWWNVLALGLAALLGYAGRFRGLTMGPHNTGETIYRVFMGFYGLLFPAYVWLGMIPSPHTPPAPRTRRIFAIAVALAIPFYFLGFIEQKMLWLLPGVVVVLVSRLFLNPQRAVPPERASA